jgi:hypothetical protein
VTVPGKGFVSSLPCLFPRSEKAVQRFLKNFMGVIQGLSSGSLRGLCSPAEDAGCMGKRDGSRRSAGTPGRGAKLTSQEEIVTHSAIEVLDQGTGPNERGV